MAESFSYIVNHASFFYETVMTTPITLLALRRSSTLVIREVLLYTVLYVGHFKKCKELLETRLDANMFHDHEASLMSHTCNKNHFNRVKGIPTLLRPALH